MVQAYCPGDCRTTRCSDPVAGASGVTSQNSFASFLRERTIHFCSRSSPPNSRPSPYGMRPSSCRPGRGWRGGGCHCP
jgi:hypothetical protein